MTSAIALHLSAATFGSLASGRLSLDESINSGRLVVEGGGQSFDRVEGALAAARVLAHQPVILQQPPQAP